MNDMPLKILKGEIKSSAYIEPINILIQLKEMIENERQERINDALNFCEEINNLSLQGCCCGYHEKPVD